MKFRFIINEQSLLLINHMELVDVVKLDDTSNDVVTLELSRTTSVMYKNIVDGKLITSRIRINSTVDRNNICIPVTPGQLVSIYHITYVITSGDLSRQELTEHLFHGTHELTLAKGTGVIEKGIVRKLTEDITVELPSYNPEVIILKGTHLYNCENNIKIILEQDTQAYLMTAISMKHRLVAIIILVLMVMIIVALVIFVVFGIRQNND